jgi:hypothetical protein
VFNCLDYMQWLSNQLKTVTNEIKCQISGIGMELFKVPIKE